MITFINRSLNWVLPHCLQTFVGFSWHWYLHFSSATIVLRTLLVTGWPILPGLPEFYKFWREKCFRMKVPRHILGNYLVLGKSWWLVTSSLYMEGPKSFFNVFNASLNYWTPHWLLTAYKVKSPLAHNNQLLHYSSPKLQLQSIF